MNCPRVMISAPHGRSGKTTVSIGVVAALAARGLTVQPFKKGPDYIDPSWLTGAGGRVCRNLDVVMMGEEAAVASFLHGAEGADVSVVEGAMGLYDGLDLEGTGSSAALARLLKLPVLLVVDATRMTRSVAALVSGYQHFEPGVNVAGVILNNVAHARHEKMLAAAVERYCGIPVVGAIPRRDDLTIPDRHLGLVPRAENERLVPAIAVALQVVEEHVNLDLLLLIANGAPDLKQESEERGSEEQGARGEERGSEGRAGEEQGARGKERGSEEQGARSEKSPPFPLGDSSNLPLPMGDPSNLPLPLGDSSNLPLPLGEGRGEGVPAGSAGVPPASGGRAARRAVPGGARASTPVPGRSSSTAPGGGGHLARASGAPRPAGAARPTDTGDGAGPGTARREARPPRHPSVRIAVLRDRVFTFYYPENLEALEAAGAELVFVDSLADAALPGVGALYIGGGFPEVFMEQLEANESLRRDIRQRAGAGMPVYAECAGLIYLSRRVRWGDRSAEMAGVLPCDVEMTARPQGHGYAVAEVVEENPFFPVGETLRGHEFHNTRVSHLDLGAARFAYRLARGAGIDGGRADGLLLGNVLASYTHLHAAAVPGWAGRFVDAARLYWSRESSGASERR